MLEKILCKHCWHKSGKHRFWQDLTHGHGCSSQDKYDLICSKCGKTLTVPEDRVTKLNLKKEYDY